MILTSVKSLKVVNISLINLLLNIKEVMRDVVRLGWLVFRLPVQPLNKFQMHVIRFDVRVLKDTGI